MPSTKRKRTYRRPSLLPELRRMPEVGDLVAIQDLDGHIEPLIVIQLHHSERKLPDKKNKRYKRKNKNYMTHPGVTCLNGNAVRFYLVSDLKLLLPLKMFLEEE